MMRMIFMYVYTIIYSIMGGESTMLHNVLDVCELRFTFDQKLTQFYSDQVKVCKCPLFSDIFGDVGP